MMSESPRVKQKPHDDDNQVTVLVDSEASHYFDNQLAPQLKSP